MKCEVSQNLHSDSANAPVFPIAAYPCTYAAGPESVAPPLICRSRQERSSPFRPFSSLRLRRPQSNPIEGQTGQRRAGVPASYGVPATANSAFKDIVRATSQRPPSRRSHHLIFTKIPPTTYPKKYINLSYSGYPLRLIDVAYSLKTIFQNA
jgi:hypothetical protein